MEASAYATYIEQPTRAPFAISRVLFSHKIYDRLVFVKVSGLELHLTMPADMASIYLHYLSI